MVLSPRLHLSQRDGATLPQWCYVSRVEAVMHAGVWVCRMCVQTHTINATFFFFFLTEMRPVGANVNTHSHTDWADNSWPVLCAMCWIDGSKTGSRSCTLGCAFALICVQRMPVRDDIDLLCRNTRAFESHFQRRTRHVHTEWKWEFKVGRSQKHIFDVKATSRCPRNGTWDTQKGGALRHHSSRSSWWHQATANEMDAEG